MAFTLRAGCRDLSVRAVERAERVGPGHATPQLATKTAQSNYRYDLGSAGLHEVSE